MSETYEPWTLRYVKIRGFALLLNAVARISVAYCACALFLPPWLRLPRPLEYYFFAETIFYAASKLYRHFYIQRDALHPERPSAEQRRQLFNQCLDTTTDYEAYISKWFLGARVADIKREDVKIFMRWAFFSLSEDDPDYEEEVEVYTKEFEDRSGIRFEPGYSGAKSLRLTVEKVYALHRSLLWYQCILVVDTLTTFYLVVQGFRHYRSSLTNTLAKIPPRPQVFIPHSISPAKNLSYWYRPHTSKKSLPILFLHGIGVGLWPYTDFFKEIKQSQPSDDGDIGIIAIELLQICSRLTSPMLQKEVMCQQIKKILDHHGIEDFLLMTHSYGSVVATHLLQTPDIADRIASIMLVDPITLLLSQPDVAYNFTIRKPYTAQQWLIWYFGSKDIGVAHTLGRHFFWQDNILQKEELAGRNAAVFLSSDDCIVNAPMVRDYLLDGKADSKQIDGSAHKGKTVVKLQKKGQESALKPTITMNREGVKVIWGAGLDHAQVFDVPDWRKVLLNETLKQARLGRIRAST